MKYVSRIKLQEIKAVRIDAPGSRAVKEYRNGEQIFLSPDRDVKDLQKWKSTAEKVSLLVQLIQELKTETDWNIEIDTWEE